MQSTHNNNITEPTTTNSSKKQEAPEKKISLFEKYGGQQSVDKVVEAFYGKILNNDTVKHFFENTNIRRLKNHQKRFVAIALGGPNRYSGRSMRASHKRLDLNDEHFDVVVSTLLETLGEHGVEDADLEKVNEILEGTRADILNKDQN